MIKTSRRLEEFKSKMGKVGDRATRSKCELRTKIESVRTEDKVIQDKVGRKLLIGIILTAIASIIVLGVYIILEIPGLPWKPDYSLEYAIGFLVFLSLLVILGKIIDKCCSKSLDKILSQK